MGLLAVAAVAFYLVSTVIDRAQHGRCRNDGVNMECSFQPKRPLPSSLPSGRGGETLV